MLLSNLDLLATAPGGVARLRELILTLAVQGKLVPQDSTDEPASALLQKIRAEKDRLIAEGKTKRDKPLAEIVEEEKPFELPSSWAWVRLADVVRVLNGRAYGKQELLDAGPVPVLRVGNLFTSNHWYYSDLELESEKYCEVGDLLYAWSASFGPFIWQGPKAIFHYHIWKLEPWAPHFFDTGYFHKFLSEKTAEIKAAGHGVSMVHMTKEKMEKIVVPYPPLSEQSRIVTRVEELMRLCDALEAKGQLETAQHAQLVSTLLSTLTASTTPEQLADNWQRVAQHFDLLLDRPEAIDALEQTLLQLAVRGLLVPQDPADESAYAYLSRLHASIHDEPARDSKHVRFWSDDQKLQKGWCWTSIASIAECLDYMRTPVKKEDRGTSNAGVPYYGANGQVGWIDDFIFDEDLVLVVEDETFIGRTKPFSYVVRGKSWVNNHAHVLRPREGMDLEYLNMCLERYDFVPLTSGTTNRRKLTKAGLLDAQVMLAPPAEQSRIVTSVTDLRCLCADLRQRLTERQSVQACLAEALVGVGSFS